MDGAKVLQDVVVVEAGSRGAVAVCGSLLAQLGATVIALETAKDSPKARHRAPYMAGKRSLRPDPSSPADRAMMERLFSGGDIVLVSSDLDPEWLRPVGGSAPGNVICDITAFGSTGPLTGRPLSELGVQALSGIMDTTGFPDGPPVPITVPIVDVIAGTYAASAALAAHRVKRRQGIGQLIDIALFDGAFAALRSFLTSVLTSETANQSRLGNRHPTVAPWNLFPSSDGHVVICAGNTYAMFERLCALIGHPEVAAKYPTQKARMDGIPEFDPLIEGWTRRFTTEECVTKLLGVGVVSGPLAPVDDYPREANLDFRGMIRRAFDPVSGREIYLPGSPLRLSATPGLNSTRIPEPDADRNELTRLAGTLPAKTNGSNLPPRQRPLEGVRIVEFGQYTTAPMCARELAHLGAEVIKIEQPTAAESRSGAQVSFRMNNADKKTMVIDLKDGSDVEALRRLLATADVLVENLKPGTLAKFGFTPEAIRSLNPRLIYCPISGFGIDSLYPTRPAFDMVITAMAGVMAVLSADGTPLKAGVSTADFMGGIMAIVAILAALDHVDRTGEGQMIDLSMQDISAWLTQTAWNGSLEGRTEPAVVAASDGYILVEAGDSALDDALRCAAPDTLARDELAETTRDALVERLGALGVQAVPVQTVREASRMAHTIERKLWFMIREDGRDWPVLGSPLRLTATPPAVTHLALPMNHDREAILQELGLAEPA
ncbi:CaiB/BaiF CoA transferase family protein [Faunimonas sp. B44]|uniref:CaiB/BaiF CoA transferase family protein n=1 Tax=Faunimonas sp. B44 TaxID=3461493 RepID=UPI004043CD77